SRTAPPTPEASPVPPKLVTGLRSTRATPVWPLRRAERVSGVVGPIDRSLPAAGDGRAPSAHSGTDVRCPTRARQPSQGDVAAQCSAGRYRGHTCGTCEIDL